MENNNQHGGDIYKVRRDLGQSGTELLDFSANINPIGPPEWLRSTISRSVEDLVHYPEPNCHRLVEAISKRYNISTGSIIAANGTTELLYMLPSIVSVSRVLLPVPSYIDYEKVIAMDDIDIEYYPLYANNDFCLDLKDFCGKIYENDLVIIGSPNNPTGKTVNNKELVKLAIDNPKALFVIDEAFLEFVDENISVAGKADNIITLHSLTKFYAIPGLRLGFGVFPEQIALEIRRRIPPWSVNTIAQEVGIQVMSDMTYGDKTRRICRELKKNLEKELSKIRSLKLYSGHANYLLLKVSGMTAVELKEKLIKFGIIIRVCGNYKGLNENYFRIAIRTKEENARLLFGIKSVLGGTLPKLKKKTGTLMFQGTSSNAGKSVLTAALCRILLEDGVRVAPFKSQNMSLNSFVTLDGLEMGRAQVVQAQAAKLDPDVRMNPVLLKPNSDTGSQVIMRGKPVGNMSVLEYVNYKKKVWPVACKCFDELSDEFDAVILEGAGSPGEVNLKHHDIVNMRMAEYAKSPVVLVGDIDRGGVYAGFVGTMEVLDEWERQLVAGFMVNRFRGQASLLGPAHDYVKSFTNKDVLGVVPYVHDHGIPEEDSVSFKEGLFDQAKPACEYVEIALINLPHLSNFTDIEPFVKEPDVHLRVIDNVDDLGTPSAIIIPGSKNVLSDLDFLYASGFAEAIKRKAEHTVIIGICGGYQMLGRSICDPYKIESGRGDIEGLNLLDMVTTLEKNKKLTRQKGVHLQSGCEVYGYEIHHGISSSMGSPILEFDNGNKCGISHKDGLIWGSYLHGIFDADGFRRWFIDGLRNRSGLEKVNKALVTYDLETSFDRLASIVRENINMDEIYRIMKL